MKKLLKNLIIGGLLLASSVTAISYVYPFAGGTGQDSSEWDGLASIAGGVWSATTTLEISDGTNILSIINPYSSLENATSSIGTGSLMHGALTATTSSPISVLSSGQVKTTQYDSSGNELAFGLSNISNGISSGYGSYSHSFNRTWNGTGWDRWPSIENGTSTDAGLVGITDGSYIASVSSAGYLYVHPVNTTTLSDARGTSAVGFSGAALYGLNASSTFDRLRSVNTGQLKTTSYDSSGTEVFDVTTAPAHILRPNTDALSSATDGLFVVSSNYVFNGTTLDRLRNVTGMSAGKSLGVTSYDSAGNTIISRITSADAQANTGRSLAVSSVLMLDNGSTLDRAKGVNTGQLKITNYDSSGDEWTQAQLNFGGTNRETRFTMGGINAFDGTKFEAVGIDDATNRNLNVRIRSGANIAAIGNPYSSQGATLTALKTTSMLHGAITSTTSAALPTISNSTLTNALGVGITDGTSTADIIALNSDNLTSADYDGLLVGASLYARDPSGNLDRVKLGSQKGLYTTLIGEPDGDILNMDFPNREAILTSTVSLPTVNFNYGYNGTTWDRLMTTGAGASANSLQTSMVGLDELSTIRLATVNSIIDLSIATGYGIDSNSYTRAWSGSNWRRVANLQKGADDSAMQVTISDGVSLALIDPVPDALRTSSYDSGGNEQFGFDAQVDTTALNNTISAANVGNTNASANYWWDGSSYRRATSHITTSASIGSAYGLDVVSFPYMWIDGASTWRQSEGFQALTDSDPNMDTAYLQGVHSLLSARKDANTTIGLTATDGTYNALHSAITDGTNILTVQSSYADATSNSINSISTMSSLHGFNGTTWDRLRTVGTGILSSNLQKNDGTPVGIINFTSDGLATNVIGLITGSFLHGFNGTTWDRVKTVNTGQLVSTIKNSSGVELELNGEGKIIPLTHDESEIHDGGMYTVSHLFSAVADDGWAYLRISVHADHFLHTTFAVETEAKAYIHLYEDTTYTGNGTTVTAYNNNRSSGNTTDSTIYHTPTIDTLGTELRVALQGTAGKFSETGGSSSSQNERILDKSTDYLIAVQNKGGAEKDIAIRLRFSEN